MKEQEQMEQKQKQMCEEIEASLDLNEMFRDLAFISGTMGGESESDSEEKQKQRRKRQRRIRRRKSLYLFERHIVLHQRRNQ